MVFTGEGSLLVFGGSSGGIVMNDLWQLSLSTMTWTQRTGLGTPPPARAFHTAVSAGMDDLMLVFGGKDPNGQDLGDVWSFRFSFVPIGLPGGWHQVQPSGPPPAARHGHAAGYSPANGIMMIWGGSGTGVDGHVWVLQNLWGVATAPEWVRYPHTGTPPSPRSGHSAVFDPWQRRLVVFGGGDPPLNDAYAYNEVPATWTTLMPAPAPQIGAPPPRRFHSAAFWNGRMALYGGSGTGSSPLADTWQLDLGSPGSGSWGALSPTARRGHTLVAYDADRMLMFGGFDGVEEKQDTWWLRLDGAGPAWQQIVTPTAPPARELHAATVLYGGRLLLFGGRYGATLMNDLWALDASVPSPDWVALTPDGSPPSPRAGHSMTYAGWLDAYVFGGTTGPGAWSNETWGLSVTPAPGSWVPLAPYGTPPAPREGHVTGGFIIPDIANVNMAVIGGEGAALYGDYWYLQWGQTWIDRGTLSMPPRAYAGGVIWSMNEASRFYVFGGEGESGPLQDTWRTYIDETSTPLPTTGGPPPARRMMGFALRNTSAPAAEVLLYGGDDGAAPLGDLWQLEIEGLPTAVRDFEAPDLRLSAVSPNPGSGAGRAALALPRAARVRAAVYDITGRRVHSVVDRTLESGHHPLAWSLDGARAGIYVLRVEVDGVASARRFALVR
jgi:hypothetical protein